jgi:hypothetical protein
VEIVDIKEENQDIPEEHRILPEERLKKIQGKKHFLKIGIRLKLNPPEMNRQPRTFCNLKLQNRPGIYFPFFNFYVGG